MKFYCSNFRFYAQIIIMTHCLRKLLVERSELLYLLFPRSPVYLNPRNSVHSYYSRHSISSFIPQILNAFCSSCK